MSQTNSATAALLKAREVGARMNCLASTVLKRHKAGTLPVRAVRIGNRIMFNAADVDALINGTPTNVGSAQ